MVRRAILPGLLALAAVLPAAAQTRSSATPAGVLGGFGTSLLMTDDGLFVGRPGEFPAFPMPPSLPGAVHHFRWADGAWTETAALRDEHVSVGDGFGSTLASAGAILLIGAPKADGGMGATHIYRKDAGGWLFDHRVTGSAEGAAAGSGLAVHGPHALIGEPGAEETGSVSSLERGADGSWNATRLTPPADLTPGDRFGATLAVKGNLLFVGAPGPHPAISLIGSPPQFRQGKVYVYQLGQGGWQLKQTLAPNDSTARGFGAVMANTEDGILISAPASNQARGAVFAFAPGEGGSWAQTSVIAQDPGQPFAFLGTSVAVAGSDVLAGAPVVGGLAGRVFVFRPDTAGGWMESQQLAVQGIGLALFFGGSAAASDDVAVFGAPGADFFDGVGYVFTRGADGSWTEEGSIVNAPSDMERVAGMEHPCTDGQAGGFTCEGVDLVSFMPIRDFGGSRGIMVNDVWGWTDPETGKEYAIIGRFDGTAFIDVSDPVNPVFLGELPLTEGSRGNLWRDMKVFKNHTFIVADNAGQAGVQIFDLTQLRDFSGEPQVFSETARYDEIASAHNIVVNEETGFAFVVGASGGGNTCGGGLHMIDINDPANPVFAGCFADPNTGNAGTGYSHDAMCVIYQGPDSTHTGKEVCFGANETALSIADVSDKANPVALAAAAYPNVGYSHQGWISDDHRYFFLNDELDELSGQAETTRTLVWDVEDLDDPVLLTEYFGPTPASDHNLYVKGRYMYQANYVSGLRVIDIEDPANPREVGYFDTMPYGEDVPGFAGAFSVYPYFESGTLLVSSMREGLFLLKKQPEPITP